MATIIEDVKSNKASWLWRFLLLLLLGVLGFVAKWGFAEMTAIPKVYRPKAEQQVIDQRQDRQIEAMQHEISEGFKETQRMIIDLHK
jgi:hypothetical protein